MNASRDYFEQYVASRCLNRHPSAALFCFEDAGHLGGPHKSCGRVFQWANDRVDDNPAFNPMFRDEDK